MNRFRPTLELLEDRVVLDAYVFTPVIGMGTVNWNDPNQWRNVTQGNVVLGYPGQNDQVENATDTVEIAQSAVNINVPFSLEGGGNPVVAVKQLLIPNSYTGTIFLSAYMGLAVSNPLDLGYLTSYIQGGTFNLYTWSYLEFGKFSQINFGSVNINASGVPNTQQVLINNGARVTYEPTVSENTVWQADVVQTNTIGFNNSTFTYLNDGNLASNLWANSWLLDHFGTVLNFEQLTQYTPDGPVRGALLLNGDMINHGTIQRPEALTPFLLSSTSFTNYGVVTIAQRNEVIFHSNVLNLNEFNVGASSSATAPTIIRFNSGFTQGTAGAGGPNPGPNPVPIGGNPVFNVNPPNSGSNSEVWVVGNLIFYDGKMEYDPQNQLQSSNWIRTIVNGNVTFAGNSQLVLGVHYSGVNTSRAWADILTITGDIELLNQATLIIKIVSPQGLYPGTRLLSLAVISVSGSDGQNNTWSSVTKQDGTAIGDQYTLTLDDSTAGLLAWYLAGIGDGGSLET